MTDVDIQAVAADLAKTAAALDRHIAAKGKEIGDKFGITYAKAAKEQVDEAKAEAVRWQGCNAELRRQMKPLTRHTYAHVALEKRLHELIAWAKERDGSVPAEMLFAALGDARTVAHAKWEREQADAEQQAAPGG